MNNCKDPLILSLGDGRYRVNKPKDQSGKYVDKQIADELLEACKWARDQFKKLADEGKYPEFMLIKNGGEGIMPLVNAIKSATT